MRDDVDARRCLRCEDARWYRGGLPSHPAHCLRITVPSANTYGSPAAAQCALQVSQRLRRSVSLRVCVCLYVSKRSDTGLQKYLYSLKHVKHVNVSLLFYVTLRPTQRWLLIVKWKVCFVSFFVLILCRDTFSCSLSCMCFWIFCLPAAHIKTLDIFLAILHKLQWYKSLPVR